VKYQLISVIFVPTINVLGVIVSKNCLSAITSPISPARLVRVLRLRMDYVLIMASAA